MGSMPSVAQAAAMACAGCCCSVESGPATMPWAPISASQVRPSSIAFGLAHHDDRGGTVVDGGGVARGDGAGLGERGPQACRGVFGGGVGANALVVGEDDRVAFALGDGHGDDLVVEQSVLPGGGRALVRRGGERVLFCAGRAG